MTRQIFPLRLLRRKWSSQPVPPFPKRSIDRMAPVQKRQNRIPPQPDFLQRPPNPEIASRRNHAFFQRLNRFRCPPCLVIHLGQIQIKLRMIAFYANGLAAKRLAVRKTPLGKRSQQARIGKIKRIFRRNSQRTPRMCQSVGCIAVSQSPQAFLELHHSSISRRRSTNPVGHGPPSNREKSRSLK
jgi:hypothetical protein